MLSDIKCDCIFSPNNSFIKQKSMPDEIPTDDDDQYIQIDHTPAFHKDNSPGTKFIDPTEGILFDLIAKIKNMVFMKDEEERSPSPADYGKIQRTIAIPAYRQTIEYLLNQLQNKLLERKIVGCISNIYFIILKGREFYYNIMENPELYKQISNMCNRNYFLFVDRLITNHQYYIRK